MSEQLDKDAAERLLRAIFGVRGPAPVCPQCGGSCPLIGGCYRCGAVPFCQVINDDGVCLRCGADQNDPGEQDGYMERKLHIVRDEEERL